MNFFKWQYWFRVWFKIAVDAFTNNRDDATDFGYVILACKRIAVSQFTNYHVKFSQRQANEIAHDLVWGSHILS